MTALLLLVLLHLAPCGARAQAADPDKERAGSPRTGSITGRVFGEDGRPLAEAVVHVSRVYARVPGPPLSAGTDGEGRFRVSELEPGLYNVNVLLPGFVRVPEPRADAGDEPVYYRPGDNLSVTLAKGGVITGTVRDANGEPVIAISVRVIRVRDELGRPGAAHRFYGFLPERLTDDRGVYRLYGLPPGTYLVVAGGGQRLYGAFNAYRGDAPTYFPSSTRDTANEVSIRGGEEASGIDIRYRGERGHIVSGTISGPQLDPGRFGTSVMLRRISSGELEGVSYPSYDVKRSFSFAGLADGEYELTAQQWGGEGAGLSSIPRRVTVKGADVPGIALALAPLASIAGRVQLEPAPKEGCVKPGRGANLFEIAVSARRDEKLRGKEPPAQPYFPTPGATPTGEGAFSIRNLLEGSYRLAVRLPAEGWYTRSIVPPGAAQNQPGAAQKPAAAGGAPLALRMGQTLAGVEVSVAQDGATLGGLVRAAAEGSAVPPGLRVHLVPAERERAEDVLRYAEAGVADDGTFSLTNLAPGRYTLLLRPVAEAESADGRPLAWDAEARAGLRRAAGAAGAPAVELKPCQRLADYELRYAPAAPAKP